MKYRRALAACVLVLMASGLAACDGESAEQRARAAAEKIQSSIPNQLAVALEQDAAPEQIKEAQEALTSIDEYMGEVNGELDAVTVNAIQAFQRSHGLADDGILDEETRRLLREAKARKASQRSERPADQGDAGSAS
jgi:peptidoglycan hydrolase-like protein with peptidoglycan-binding domain